MSKPKLAQLQDEVVDHMKELDATTAQYRSVRAVVELRSNGDRPPLTMQLVLPDGVAIPVVLGPDDLAYDEALAEAGTGLGEKILQIWGEIARVADSAVQYGEQSRQAQAAVAAAAGDGS